MPDDSSAETITCRCGHGLGHNMVSADPEYTPLGWLMVTFGISASPKQIKYRCRRCNEVVGETDDPKVLDAHY